MMTQKFRSVLVANRGEIARRVMRSCRDVGLRTVAVFSDADEDEPFVTEADLAVRLPGVTATDTYLRADLIIEAARRTGAEAIHPGYGFLSENADFARATLDAGLVFIGPPPEAMELMGDKLRSKTRMQELGVPVLPAIEVTHLTAGELRKAATDIGFPLLVKASAGGGGRGMRIVRDLEQTSDAVAAARREAQSAFGDETVFLERYLEAPRHIEIQVFADAHDQVVALFERECSIQRRHQKIVEECPSPAVNDTLRKQLSEAAVTTARAADYRGAGTVEFVLAEDGSFYFLEMNTRLQVEHPVTEAVTGLDLVRLQLDVAQGLPLPEEALSPTMSGHAIEVRLYAEDPANGFLPTAGRIHDFSFESTPGLRVDAGVRAGSVVSTYYDSMLAKVIAHAVDRTTAAGVLAKSLRLMHVDGVVTNRQLLVDVLEHPRFLAGATPTSFLDDHTDLLAARAVDERLRLHALVAALSGYARAPEEHSVLPAVPAGWRNNPPMRSQDRALERVQYAVQDTTVNIGFSIAGREVTAEVDGERVDAVALHLSADVVDLEVAGIRRTYTVLAVDDVVHVHDADVMTTLGELSRFPATDDGGHAGSATAPMPGVVLDVLVNQGCVVSTGDRLVVLEAMKMEHTVTSPTDGTVAEVLVASGDQVEAGAVLVVLADDADDDADATPA